MRKIVFDNSIHLGQFCISDESMRIFCKNSQTMISEKQNNSCIGIESFNENTFSDDIIWGKAREAQDIFYRFMDRYHSLKNIERVPLSREDAQSALDLSQNLNIDISNALTCAIAIRTNSNEIHSFYSDFKKENVVDFLKTHGVHFKNTGSEKELTFSEQVLEECYKKSFECFKQYNIDLIKNFHM